MADIMADEIDLRQGFDHYAGGRNDRAWKLPRLAQRNGAGSGDSRRVPWWMWLLTIWCGALLISLVLLAGFGVVDWLRHKSPDADTNADSPLASPGRQLDGTLG
jgi:hypothetical protein